MIAADGYDYRYDEYDFPTVAEHDSRDLDELAILFEEGFADVPFTAAEEEMLPPDGCEICTDHFDPKSNNHCPVCHI